MKEFTPPDDCYVRTALLIAFLKTILITAFRDFLFYFFLFLLLVFNNSRASV